MYSTEALFDFLSRTVGPRNTHLAVVRSKENVDYDAPFELMNDTCCTEYSGSLKEEIIKRASFSHPLYKEDNTTVCYRLEKATISMVYSASINPFQTKKTSQMIGYL